MQVPLEGGPVRIVGALDLDRTETGISPRRLPAWTRPQIPDLFMEFMVTLGSGVRLTFRTDSPWIELDAFPTGFRVVGSPAPPVMFDLVVDGERVQRMPGDFGPRLVLDLATLAVTVDRGDAGTVRFAGLGDGTKDCEIWLPQSAATELRELRVADGARVEPATTTRRRWAHYGSSISHCVEAHGPTEVWPAVAARIGDVDLVQFGFAGQCHLDQFVARAIVEQEPDLVSLKVGINIVNADSMTVRTFPPALHGFLDTLRAGSPTHRSSSHRRSSARWPRTTRGPRCPMGTAASGSSPTPRRSCAPSSLTLRGHSPGSSPRSSPAAGSGATPPLWYLDGLELFGSEDAAGLPDGLHPDGDGYVRIGERFAADGVRGGRSVLLALSPVERPADPRYLRSLSGGCRALCDRARRPRRRRAHHGDADAGCATTPIPAIRDRIAPCATRAATSCARPAIPRSSCATSTPRSTRLAAKHRSDEYRATEADEIMARKNFAATGSFLAEDRPRALDLLGFASQLVFNTFHNRRLHDWEHGGDLDLAYGAARAHNRGMVEFCSVDARLLPTLLRARSPTSTAAEAMADEAIAMGAAALLVASGCPQGPLAEPPRRSTRCGRRRRRPGSRSCSTSAAPATSSTRTTSATACRSRPTSTAARRTSGPSTTWASPGRRRRRSRR